VPSRDSTVERGAPDVLASRIKTRLFLFSRCHFFKKKTARNAVGNPVTYQAALRAAQSIASNIALSQTLLAFLPTENTLTLV
jgi:hypothetical protein